MKGFTRPPSVVLPESAVVPDRNLIVPAPNQFTHVLTQPEPFSFTGQLQGNPPDGELPQGANVVLLVYDGGPLCWVADGQGLYVQIAFEGLKKLL